MIQHYNKHELILVGKAKDIQLALASIKKESKQNETLQHYLLQRPIVSFQLKLK